MKRKIKCLISGLMLSTIICTVSNADISKYSDLDGIKNDIYTSGMNRETSYSFIYSGSKNDIINNLIDTVKEGYSQDDYLGKSWSKIGYSAKLTKKGIKITVNTDFTTTKEQEEYIDTALKNIVNSIIKPNMTDYEKIKTINDYIVNMYEYDYDLYDKVVKLNAGTIDNSKRQEIYSNTSVYHALESKKTVCQGYAMTAYKMMKDAGIECKIISGTLKGSEHVWNEVKLNNKWYYLDITGNDTSKSNKYFLVSGEILKNDQYAWIQ